MKKSYKKIVGSLLTLTLMGLSVHAASAKANTKPDNRTTAMDRISSKEQKMPKLALIDSAKVFSSYTEAQSKLQELKDIETDARGKLEEMIKELDSMKKSYTDKMNAAQSDSLKDSARSELQNEAMEIARSIQEKEQKAGAFERETIANLTMRQREIYMYYGQKIREASDAVSREANEKHNGQLMLTVDKVSPSFFFFNEDMVPDLTQSVIERLNADSENDA